MSGQARLTVEDITSAARRGAVALASDPEMQPYSADTLGLIYERTIDNMAGAGGLHRAAERIANDPALAHVPIDVLDAIVAASFKHFARALRPGAAS